MKTNAVIAIVVIIITAVGGYFFFTADRAEAPENGVIDTNKNTMTDEGDTSMVEGGTVENSGIGERMPADESSDMMEKTDTEPSEGMADNAAATSPTVTYTSNGYTPSTRTIDAGDVVVFVNESSRSMWPASNVHPTHSHYDGTPLRDHCEGSAGPSFDACTGVASGDSWTFTFDKAGEWQYHDHLNPRSGGTIIVQ